MWPRSWGLGDRAAKDALFDAFAEVAKALASGRRAEIADLLGQGERPVEEIAAEIGQSVANTSHHLRAMARAGLVATRRDGTRIFYRLASDRVGELWAAMRDVAAGHVAGLERLARAYLGERDGIEVVGREELAARLESGEVVVLDVRPSAEYDSGHIAGARSAPIAELRRHLRALPSGVNVVAYCRGPYCVYADEAVRELDRQGFRARRLIDGYPEWNGPACRSPRPPEPSGASRGRNADRAGGGRGAGELGLLGGPGRRAGAGDRRAAVPAGDAGRRPQAPAGGPRSRPTRTCTPTACQGPGSWPPTTTRRSLRRRPGAALSITVGWPTGTRPTWAD